MPVSNATLKKVAVLGGIVAISGASFFKWKIQGQCLEIFLSTKFYIYYVLIGWNDAVHLSWKVVHLLCTWWRTICFSDLHNVKKCVKGE